MNEQWRWFSKYDIGTAVFGRIVGWPNGEKRHIGSDWGV